MQACIPLYSIRFHTNILFSVENVYLCTFLSLCMKKKLVENIRICLLFALLLLPIGYALCVAIDLEYSVFKKLAYFWVVLLLLLFPALFLKARTYFLVEGVFNFLLFPIDIASLYLNRQSTSVAFLQNIMRTDMQEASELMLSMWPVCVAVVLLYVLYFVLAFKIENKPLITAGLKKAIWIGGGLAVMVGLVVFISLGSKLRNNASKTELIYYAVDRACMKLYKIFPYNLYLHSIDIVSKHREQQRLQEQIASFSFGITPVQPDSNALYILVIGEAARYDHWGINGYARNTTPLLATQRNVISYTNTYSQANLTSYSVPLILSRATAKEPNIAYREKSIVGAFQEAGFVSGYINKQLPIAIEARILENCDYPFQYGKSIDVDGNYDAEMVDKLSEFVSDTAQFFVLHTLGNHFRYEHRYPTNFEAYQPVMGSSFSYALINESNKEKLINAYDNAILYTDYVLNKLITYVDSLNRPAVVLYISDHGESFWDDARKLSLHGSYQIAKAEFHVPMLIWYSDQYKETYPLKVDCMEQNKDKWITSNAIFYSLLDIAGVKEVVDSTQSICSNALQEVDSTWVFDGQGQTHAVSLRQLSAF